MNSTPNSSSEMTVSIVDAHPSTFVRRVDELIDIHLSAMSYPSSAHTSRRTLWITNAQREDFTASIALLHHTSEAPNLKNPHQRALGVAYCFKGTPHTWWYKQVARGLAERGASESEVTTTMNSYAELSEIHVRPNAQHFGIGRALLNAIITRCPQDTLMLSTPEAPGEDNAAWKLYRSVGFTDVLRNFYFPSDPRPFGILQLKR